VTWNDAAAVAERSFVAWEKCLNDYRKDYSTAPATADRARNLCLEALRAASAINCAERVYGSDAPKGEELLDLETALTPARDKRHPAANFIDQFRKQAGRWRDFVQKTRHSAGASQQSQPKVPAPGSQIRSLLLRALDQHFTLDQRLQKLIDDTCNPPK
jgi:hypothetical protein